MPMKVEHLILARKWFENFADSFVSSDGTLSPLLRLKKEHSYRVEANSSSIATMLEWTTDDIRIADALGLLHDVGRFPQYSNYGTFFDATSIDHGEEGAGLLAQSFPWDGIRQDVKNMIVEGVRFHNKKNLKDVQESSVLPMARIVRDADKLDIFDLIRRYVKEEKITDIIPGLQMEERISAGLLKELKVGYDSSYKNVRTLSDFLVLQLSWVFDINYPVTFEILKERKSVSWLLDRLNNIEEIHFFLEKADAHVSAQLMKLP